MSRVLILVLVIVFTRIVFSLTFRVEPLSVGNTTEVPRFLSEDEHEQIFSVGMLRRGVIQDQEEESNSHQQISEHSNEVHLVFANDCDETNDWQAQLLIHSAQVVGQQGKITRILSGCSDNRKRSL